MIIYESGEKLEDKSWGFGTLMETQVSEEWHINYNSRATPGENFDENPNPKIQVADQSYLTLHNCLPKLYSHTVLVDIFINPELQSMTATIDARHPSSLSG